MDCKKVLTETDGDMEKAAELLRERGIAKAAKKSGRIAAEGSTARQKTFNGLWNTGDVTGRGLTAGVIGYARIDINSKCTFTNFYISLHIKKTI